MAAIPVRSLTVVLPAYNESGIIKETLVKLFSFLKKSNLVFEVVVVNDGSQDSTEEILRLLQKQYSELVVVTHEQNRGYGEALRSGFNAAKMDWILLMDSDGQFDIRDFNRFAPFAADNDLVVGIRWRRADPWPRKILTAGYNGLCWLLFGLRYDFGCAFKLFSRASWQKIQPITSKDHKIFSVEWLLKAKRSGAKIKQLPITHFPRTTGQATGTRPDVLAGMIRELLRLRFHA